MEEKKVKVFVSGCTGKQGKRLVKLVNQHPGWYVCGGFGRRQNQYDFPVLDAATVGDGMVLFDGKIDKPDVIIDFSTPTVAEFVYYNLAYRYRIPLVCATTKLSGALLDDMKDNQTMKFIPVFQAYNLSKSITSFTKRVCDSAVDLPGYDIDIVESHHKEKVDAPSGTANNLADAINAALGGTHTIIRNPSHNRPRGKNEIYITSIRRGDDLGTHTVTFAYDGEITEHTHRVTSKYIFANGAIKAAEFLLTQPAGYYNMDNL